MSKNPIVLDKALGCLEDCERTIKDVAFKLSDLAEDIAMIREEIAQAIDEERYYHNG
jgi:archaellum component FlaC